MVKKTAAKKSKGQPPHANLVEKDLSQRYVNLAAFIKEQTGYEVDDPFALQLALALYSKFQKSPMNRSYRAEETKARAAALAEREAKRAAREAAKEEKAAARAAKKASAGKKKSAPAKASKAKKTAATDEVSARRAKKTAKKKVARKPANKATAPF